MNFQSDHTRNKRVSFLTQNNVKIKITYPIPVVDPDNSKEQAQRLKAVNEQRQLVPFSKVLVAIHRKKTS
jgi:hypothetical protein